MRLFLLCFYFPLILFSQKSNSVVQGDSSYCDCKQSRNVIIKGNQKVGPILAPKDFGKIQELKPTANNEKHYFEREHHTAWYRLIFQKKGELAFDITPADTSNDYDFMMFKGGRYFCDSLLKIKPKPVRSNISRNKIEIMGKTGLIPGAKNEWVKEGPGESFSQSLKVNKNDTFYLVLDNVYPNGAGHTIRFYFASEVEIAGTLKDDESNPLEGEVLIKDFAGNEITRIKTNPETGEYKTKVVLEEMKKYNLVLSSTNSFVEIKEISTKSNDLLSIHTVLPVLKLNKKFTLRTINFHGDSPEPLQACYNSIEALYQMMKKNKNLEILIEGHVNGCTRSKNYSIQELSEKRAAKIKSIIVEKGIEEGRIKTIGYGCSKMLYPKPLDESQNSANRRVEILVTRLD